MDNKPNCGVGNGNCGPGICGCGLGGMCGCCSNLLHDFDAQVEVGSVPGNDPEKIITVHSAKQ